MSNSIDKISDRNLIEVLSSMPINNESKNGYHLVNRPDIVKGREVAYITIMYGHKVICDILSDQIDKEIIFSSYYIQESRRDPEFKLNQLEEFLRSKEGVKYWTNIRR
ncbi:hypothetical protein HYX17_02830 [Candidatus Woesearchaeota archaeon]|nr:hypothetical protein [Candidatus Woesearchaeota archaeon]